ncbi:hypothetical protein L7F22_067070 [Adiantum nelumboides]|nr:hypothetical protein [Adiantum nelumboides]
MGRCKRNHQQVKGLPHNPWFDEECKAGKHKLKCFNKSTKERESAAKEYRMLKRKKRRMHELLKEEQEVIRFKKAPKKAWRNMKGKNKDIMGNFSMDKMYVYAQTAYAPTDAQIMMDAEIQVDTKEPITFATALRGLKKLATGKASDVLHFNSKMLKWSGNEAKKWIYCMMNQAIHA